MPAPHRIVLLAFANGQLLDIAGPLQMFAGANDELSRQAYRIEIAAPRAGPFATSSSVRLGGDTSFSPIPNNRLAAAPASRCDGIKAAAPRPPLAATPPGARQSLRKWREKRCKFTRAELTLSPVHWHN